METSKIQAILAPWSFFSRMVPVFHQDASFMLLWSVAMTTWTYVALVPRGLHWIVRDSLLAEADRHGIQTIQPLAEPTVIEPLQEHQLRDELLHHYRKQVEKRPKKWQPFVEILQAATKATVGSHYPHDKASRQHWSLGYYDGSSDDATDQSTAVPICSCPGKLLGSVYLQIESAKVLNLQDIRTVGLWFSPVACFTKGLPTEADSLDETIQTLKSLIADAKNDYNLDHALEHWWQHASQRTNDPGLHERYATGALRYRISLTRPDHNTFTYGRADFCAAAVDILLRSSDKTRNWKVDLTNFDVELVVVLHAPHSLMVAFNLLPHAQHKFRCYGQTNGFPSELLPPLLDNPKEDLRNVVRLRPSTAHCLLQVAQLQPGDVVLDPCAGIGTLPVEASFLRDRNVIGIGGDLVLESLQPTVSKYQQAAQKYHSKQAGLDRAYGCDLLTWDAAKLPWRNASVDVIVSDLPFGQKCLSANELTGLLPLLLNNFARVLVPNTGRMVLLCGIFTPLLDEIVRINQQSNEPVWQLPCKALFPVCIGGTLAWIIHVERASGAAPAIRNADDKVRKMAMRRKRVADLRKYSKAGKLKKVQA